MTDKIGHMTDKIGHMTDRIGHMTDKIGHMTKECINPVSIGVTDSRTKQIITDYNLAHEHKREQRQHFFFSPDIVNNCPLGWLEIYQ